MRDRLENLDPTTEEAKTIRKNLIKLRQEKESPKLQTENPDAFLTALREVKTGTDGRIYPSNYKLLELEKAREFKIKKGLRTKNLPWISRGPGNVSGRGRSMAVDPSDPTGNTWFVATVGGGVWKTTDAGENWELKTPDLLTLSTTSIIIAPSNPDIIYLGTGMGYGRVVDLEGSGVWKSTDHGESWFQLESTANGELLEAINRMIVDPEDENTILVCSNNSYTTLGPNGGDRKSGIFKSVDGGLTWVQVFDPDDFFGLISDNRVQQIIPNPDDFDEIYATVNEVGVVKSVDEGITWTVSADDFALPGDIGRGEGTYSGVSTRVEIAIAPTDTERIYASVERPFGSATLFMSNNAGASWVELQNVGDEINWHSANGDSGADGAYTSGWFNHTITVNPFNEDLIYLGAVNIFKMLINPNAFTRSITPIAWRFAPNQYEVPYIHADNHFFVTIPDYDSQTFRIVCSNDGGIAYSPDNGVTWEMKLGTITTQFYGVDKKPGEDVYIGGTQDNGTWLSEADPAKNSTWRHVIGGDGFETVWNYRDPDLIMGASQNGNVRRTEDGGLSWFSVPEARGSGGP
ncbi:MAG: hypothetical protein HKN16_02855, partial [Saprospiraceae bacterium]|nr:hypothetical protein [Saprospiraceae bacterium]